MHIETEGFFWSLNLNWLLLHILFQSFLLKSLFFINSLKKNYLFLSLLGLRCWVGYILVAVFKILIAVASLVAEHRL